MKRKTVASTRTVNIALSMSTESMENLPNRLKVIGSLLQAEQISYSLAPLDSDQVSFTARIVAFDDTFRSDDVNPIWGLAFTSEDITDIKSLAPVIGKKQKVRVTIEKVSEEGR